MLRPERRITVFPDVWLGVADNVTGALPEVAADFERAERDTALCVRLDEVPTGVINDIPRAAFFRMLLDIVRLERLREISVVERFFACEGKDTRPGRIHYLTCVSR